MSSATAIASVNSWTSPIEVTSRRGNIDILDSVDDDWRSLAVNAFDDQPFFRPEWIRAHLRAFAPTAHVLLVEVRCAGRLCLILPLLEERGTFSKVPIRKLRAPVNVHGGRFDALRLSGAEGEASIQAVANYLLALDGWDLLQVCNTPQHSTIERIVGAMRSKSVRSLRTNDQPNPIVLVPDDNALLEAMPPNTKLRSQLRRVREKLALRGPLRFYRIENDDRAALERFYELEASGWKGRAGSAILCNGSKAFYDEMAQQAARNGYFSLFMLECGEELVAAHYSFTHRDRCYSPIVTYNEAFRQFAPGHLIIAHILAYCASNGIRYFDITGQDQPWKMKWTSQTRGMHNYFLFKGPIGQLAYRIGVSLRTVARLLHDANGHSLDMELN